jgi:uncharacterized protein (TIGR02145 family)
MKISLKHISFAIVAIYFLLTACTRKNDFYEVGRQQVFLTSPVNDTALVLNYQKPDSLYSFAWTSKRSFVNYRLVFSLNEDLSEPRKTLDVGIRQYHLLTTMQLDSIMSSMDVEIAGNADVYWTIELLNPSEGWCEDVRKINITRCNLPDNVIMLQSPESLTEINLDKSNPEEVTAFNWKCITKVSNYMLEISLNENFSNAVSLEKGPSESHNFTYQILDDLLAENGVRLGEKAKVFWRVKALGDLNNPIENSAIREVYITRFARDPVQITLSSPAKNSTKVLNVQNADDLFRFEWDCDTTGVGFTVRLSDKELEHTVNFNAGNNTYFTITQTDLDLLLEKEFEMVPSQNKIMYWEVISSDGKRAVSSARNNFTIKRFEATMQASPITLQSSPANGTNYLLNYAMGESVITNVTWDCESPTATYAIEYSLKADMSDSKVSSLTRNKSIDFTYNFLDKILTDLGGAYLTKIVYWRITSTVAVLTEPSAIKSLSLTGMLRPLVDKRDPNNLETYKVVKIGNDFWLAENLRAKKYTDGKPLPLPYKTASHSNSTFVQKAGGYYTWGTAVNIPWNTAKTKSQNNEPVQGICPCGWHLPSYAEVDALRTVLGSSAANKIKDPNYWPSGSITNSEKMGIVSSGYFWNENEESMIGQFGGSNEYMAGFWTSTPYIKGLPLAWGATAGEDDPNKAIMMGLYGTLDGIFLDGYPITPGNNRVYPVRCVRTKN